MSARIDILPGIPEDKYGYEIKITEEALQSLDDRAMQMQIGAKSNLVKFYVDRKLNLEECLSVLERLEQMAGPTGSLCIFTTGRNFNDLMKLIGTRNTTNHYEMYIDDNDIRDIIDVNGIIYDLNFSRISCVCYFSDRYLMNFNPAEFLALCKIPECKFDRERVTSLREKVEMAWLELCPSIYSIYQLSSLEKTQMVLDFVRQDIALSTRNLLSEVITNMQANQIKTQLVSLLLDNYLAQVNCRVVEGIYLPTGIPETWLVTKHNGNFYGHSLLRDYLFSNLEKKGYAEGLITLEKVHRYRDDFRYDISSYSDLDEMDYFNLKSSLATKKRNFEFPPYSRLSDASLIQNTSCSESKELSQPSASLKTLLIQERHHKDSKQPVGVPHSYMKKVNYYRQNNK